MKKSKRTLILFLMAAMLSSCGNPHLIQEEPLNSDSVIQKQDPLVVENANKEAEKTVTVENNQGGKELNYGQLPKDQEIAKEIIITSKDEDSIPVSARFEKGEHFFFNGGKFPGSNGTCTQMLKAKESCKLDIGFDASTIGKFEDQLIITTKNGSEYKIPLYGERIETPAKANTTHLVLGNLKAQTLDFGTINTGDKSTKIIEIQNNYDQPITVKSISINNENFKLIDKQNCQKEVKSGSCFIEISFEPNQAIDLESVLTIVEESGHKLEVLVKGKAVTQSKEDNQALAEAERKKLEDQIAESKRQKMALEEEARLAQEKIEQAKQAEKDALEKLKLAEEELVKKKAEADKRLLEQEQQQALIKAERERTEKEKAELARQAELNAERQRQLEAALKEAEELRKAKEEATRKLAEAERLSREAREKEELEAKRQAELLADKKRQDEKRAEAEAEYQQCVAKNEISLSLAPKTRTILASAVLPYLLTSKNTKQKLGLLYNNESNAKIKNADINIVNDAQVVSTFLTADKVNGEVDDILLTLDLTKVETDKYNETEMLCLSSQSVKKCSGRLFTLADWLILKNPEFFKLHKMPVTKTYENILSQNVIKCGDLDCERMEKTLSLKEILKLSDREMELLKKDKIIHIILTDDTRQTSSPKMIFKTKEAKECSRKLGTHSQKD